MALRDNAGERLGAELQNGFDPLPQGICSSACVGVYYFLLWRTCVHSWMHLFVIQYILKCVGILASNIVYFWVLPPGLPSLTIHFSLALSVLHIWQWNNGGDVEDITIATPFTFPPLTATDVSIFHNVWTVRWKPRPGIPSRSKNLVTTASPLWADGPFLPDVLPQTTTSSGRKTWLATVLPTPHGEGWVGLSLKARVTIHPGLPVTDGVLPIVQA